jgi:hypothetical protein
MLSLGMIVKNWWQSPPLPVDHKLNGIGLQIIWVDQGTPHSFH